MHLHEKDGTIGWL